MGTPASSMLPCDWLPVNIFHGLGSWFPDTAVCVLACLLAAALARAHRYKGRVPADSWFRACQSLGLLHATMAEAASQATQLEFAAA